MSLNCITRRQAIVRGLQTAASLALGPSVAAVGTTGCVSGSRLASSRPEKLRSDWMVGRRGLMVHWIAPRPAPEKGEWILDLNRAVDAFNLTRFLEEFEESGSDYLIFTVGQNTSWFSSPSATLDELVGPGHCSRRDLMLELAQGLHRLGKRFIPYLGSLRRVLGGAG